MAGYPYGTPSTETIQWFLRDRQYAPPLDLHPAVLLLNATLLALPTCTFTWCGGMKCDAG
jgi:hypothetical protein